MGRRRFAEPAAEGATEVPGVLVAEQTGDLVASLLDDASYDFNQLRRCRNDFYVGLRFSRGEDVVEFALGMPCEQAHFVYRDGDEIESFGALLHSVDCEKLVAASAAPEDPVTAP